MRRLAIALAAVALAAVAACSDDASRPAASTPAPTPTSTATPTATPEGPASPQAVRLTVGVSGDLLPHLPVVARARALAGGRGYDFRPLLRPIRRWVRRNSLAICHVETPLTPAPPAGYPRFNSPPALARAVRRHGLRRLQHRLEPLARPRPGRDRRDPAGAGPRRRPAHRLVLLAPAAAATAPAARPRRECRPPRLHADDERDPVAAPVVGQPRPRRADPARRAPRPPRRRAGRDRQSPLGHGVPARARRVPDGARAAARPLDAHHRRGRPARARRAADPARRPALGRVRRGQPALEPDRRMLSRRDPGRDARPASPPRRREHARASSGSRTRRPGCATPTTRSSARPPLSARRGAARSRWSAGPAMSGRCPDAQRVP